MLHESQSTRKVNNKAYFINTEKHFRNSKCFSSVQILIHWKRNNDKYYQNNNTSPVTIGCTI